MPAELKVRTGEKEYPILVGRGIYKERLPGLLHRLEPRVVAVVSHPSLREMHGKVLEEAVRVGLPADGRIVWFTFPEGEESKTLGTAVEGYRFLIREGFTREDLVLAFGGGVVGDLAGFLAATYMRGVRYLQLPTTLMSMVDSSIGGKTGVDLPEGKNIVGCFHQPEAVVADVSVLDTLPGREVLNGLAEVAKYGFLYDPDILLEMEGWPEGIPPLGYDFAPLVRSCAAHKARVVGEDERDILGIRAILNYGHTFGHALEAATGYRMLRHGEAVTLGMIMASRLAERNGSAQVPLVERHLCVLMPLLREIPRPLNVSAGEVLRFMEADKKRGKALRFVLLREWQSAELVESPPPGMVREAVEVTLRGFDEGC